MRQRGGRASGTGGGGRRASTRNGRASAGCTTIRCAAVAVCGDIVYHAEYAAGGHPSQTWPWSTFPYPVLCVMVYMVVGFMFGA